MACRSNAIRVVPFIAVLALAAGCTQADGVASGGEAPQPPGLEYVVQVDPQRPQRLQGQVDLSAHPGSGRTASVRGVSFGLASQVVDASCDGTALEPSGDAQWKLPDDCRRLAWSIEVRDAIPNAVDASLQSTLHFADAGWWLLSEPTSLPRIDDIDADVPLSVRIEGVPSDGRIVGATDMGGGAWRIPPGTSAPEFYAFGRLDLQAHAIGPLRSTYVIDDASRFARLPLPELHRKALGYLAEAFRVPADLPERDRHLLVLWLGIDEAHGEAGGAAGSRSFIANYVDGDAANLERNAVRTMLVLAHEQAHQLYDLMGTGGAPLPTWFNESFAHHYALKALARSDLDPALLDALEAAFVDPDRPVEAGLVEYNRRHESGDPEAYGMFYTQGATFWALADGMLQARNGDAGGIDALMPAFLAAEGEGPGLPATLRDLLVADGGADMQALIERYVGE